MRVNRGVRARLNKRDIVKDGVAVTVALARLRIKVDNTVRILLHTLRLDEERGPS